MDIILLYLFGSLAVGILMYFVKNTLFNYLLFIPFFAMQVLLNIHEILHINEIEGYYFGGDGEGYFKADGIGIIFLSVITILVIPTVLHSYWYTTHRREKVGSISIYNLSLVLLITMMSCALITRHVAMMWAFIEATTLAASMLIYHERDHAALEATWKYIFVCSIGIAMSFVGILFLGIAAKDAKSLDLTLEALAQNSKLMDPMWLKLTFLLVVTGYSVKMGLTPLFTVDIDAKDTAPSPVGAMLSGGLLNVGFVAIFRFYEVFSNTEILQWMNTVLMLIGMSSLFFATVYILRVKNIKRLLAYSSLEHAGIALIALASGGIGYFAVIFHLILHGLAKSSLFFQVGQLIRIYRHKNIDLISGYYKVNPWGGLVFILGFMAVMGIPPSGIFLTEFYTFKALFTAKHYFVGVWALILLSIIFYGLSRDLLQILFGKVPPSITHRATKIYAYETITQWILLSIVFVLGLYPPAFLVNFIELAVKNLPK
jgi:hydrogenase-4 component F